MARAAETAAAEITAIKNKLQTIRDTAEDFSLTIIDETGSVLLPSNLSSFSSGDQQFIIDKAADLRSDIATLLARAEDADNDLAAAIRSTSGDLSPEGVNAEVGQGPVSRCPMLPPAGTEPTDVTHLVGLTDSDPAGHAGVDEPQLDSQPRRHPLRDPRHPQSGLPDP